MTKMIHAVPNSTAADLGSLLRSLTSMLLKS
jgi:hypothetical protein